MPEKKLESGLDVEAGIRYTIRQQTGPLPGISFAAGVGELPLSGAILFCLLFSRPPPWLFGACSPTPA